MNGAIKQKVNSVLTDHATGINIYLIKGYVSANDNVEKNRLPFSGEIPRKRAKSCPQIIMLDTIIYIHVKIDAFSGKLIKSKKKDVWLRRIIIAKGYY